MLHLFVNILMLWTFIFNAFPNNNTSSIVVQGVVPGTWELTVYDINSGYDLDLSNDTTFDLTARIGTVHISSNELTSVGATLIVESVNSGRLINRSTGPGIAAENQKYYFAISQSDFSPKNGLDIDFSASSLSIDTANSIDNNYNELLIPGTMVFNAADPDGDLLDRGVYNIFVVIPEFERPESSGIYTDTIIFTIMDDN